jgi:hypothetical protein
VGPLADVRDRLQTGRRLRIGLAAPDEDDLRGALREVAGIPGVLGAELVDGGLEAHVGEGLADHELLRQLVEKGFRVRTFAPATGALASAFLRLTEPEDEG